MLPFSLFPSWIFDLLLEIIFSIKKSFLLGRSSGHSVLSIIAENQMLLFHLLIWKGFFSLNKIIDWFLLILVFVCPSWLLLQMNTSSHCFCLVVSPLPLASFKACLIIVIIYSSFTRGMKNYLLINLGIIEGGFIIPSHS